MTPSAAKQRAKEMRQLAGRLTAMANDKRLTGDFRYRAAVMSDHALQLAQEFEALLSDA